MAGELNSLTTDVKGAGEDDLNTKAAKKNILNRRSQSSQRFREWEYGLETAALSRSSGPGSSSPLLPSLPSVSNPFSAFSVSLCSPRSLCPKSVFVALV